MLYALSNKKPILEEKCYIANTASIIGDVNIGSNSSVWFSAVVRGDINFVTIGNGSNIQDNCVIHVSHEYSTKIGDNVTVGHGAILHGCTIGNNVLIGMGSTILDGSIIPDNCIIGANTIVTHKLKIEEASLILGNPGKIIRKINETDKEYILSLSKEYIKNIDLFLDGLKLIKEK